MFNSELGPSWLGEWFQQSGGWGQKPEDTAGQGVAGIRGEGGEIIKCNLGQGCGVYLSG